MRDPQRIDPLLQLIRVTWRRNPDLRLGQLIGNCVQWPLDAYYLEDDKLAARLKELYGNGD